MKYIILIITLLFLALGTGIALVKNTVILIILIAILFLLWTLTLYFIGVFVGFKKTINNGDKDSE